VNAKANATAILDLKSAALTLIAVVLKTRDLGAVAQELERRLGQGSALFDNDPVVIDLVALADDAEPLDLEALVALLASHRMRAVAVRGGHAAHREAALVLGLSEAPEELPLTASRREAAPAPATAAESAAARPSGNAGETVLSPADAPPAGPAPSVLGAPTLLLDRPLRSGQQVYARGGDLVVLAAVSFGAEVIADGSIHVYAPLRGRAIAGARGNTEARIFSTAMEPQLVSIAGIYRTTETPLAPEVLGKPAQVRLDGEKLVVEPLRF
jgi:septum site-determining protein MinC